MKREIRKILEDQLATEQADYNRHLLLREILTAYVGKKITKRLQRDLPDDYRFGYGLSGYEISYKPNTPEEKRHYLCYSQEGISFKIEYFDRADAPYNTGAIERINKLKNILSNEENFLKVYQAVSKLKVAYKRLQQAVEAIEAPPCNSYHNPGFYEILRAIEVPSRLVSDVHFNKFKY
jgi:hypothetical protein